jgi:hypothetical protein
MFWFVAFVYSYLRNEHGSGNWIAVVALAGGISWAGVSLLVAWATIARESPTGAEATATLYALMWKRGVVIAPAAAAFFRGPVFPGSGASPFRPGFAGLDSCSRSRSC